MCGFTATQRQQIGLCKRVEVSVQRRSLDPLMTPTDTGTIFTARGSGAISLICRLSAVDLITEYG